MPAFSPDTGGTLTTSLVSFYNMSGAAGSKGTDHFSTNDLTDTGTVGDVAGVLNQAADFVAASSQKLDAASGTPFDITTGDFSIAFWYKSTATGTTTLIGKNGNNAPSYRIDHQAAGKIRCVIQDTGGTNYEQKYYNTTINDGNWHHVAWRRDGDAGANLQLSLYIDGSSVALTDAGGNGNVGTLSNTVALRVGANDTPTYTTITIDGFGFWTKLLSATEVTDLYNSGNGNEYLTAATAAASMSLMGVGG